MVIILAIIFVNLFTLRFKILDKKRVKAKNIVLIDDVLTTGATCNEAAFELLKNGANRVDALVLART
jgi:predicted amidophosphoribosyltransferase